MDVPLAMYQSVTLNCDIEVIINIGLLPENSFSHTEYETDIVHSTISALNYIAFCEK